MTTRLRLLAATFIALLGLAAYLGFWDSSNHSGNTVLTPITTDDQPTDVLSIPITADARPADELSTPKGEFPEDELRSALLNVCASNTPVLANEEWTEEEIQEKVDAFNALKQSLSDSLSISSSAEHLHLAALLEDDPALRIDLLKRAISNSSSDPFLLWGAVHICSESVLTVDCPLGDWERQLIAVDSQNSESWIRVAANRYVAGQSDAALRALRQASAAAESRSYWTDKIEMIERGLAAGSDYAFPDRAMTAFGIAASELPHYEDYLNMCEEQSAKSVDWAQACFAYGELVENQGKTGMDISIARSIQRNALEALGESEQAAAVAQRLQARRQERLDSINDYNPSIERLIFSSPTLFSTYLAEIRSVGEEAAWRHMTSEVERLIERQPELNCD